MKCIFNSTLFFITISFGLLFYWGCGEDKSPINASSVGKFHFPADATGPLWEVPESYFAEVLETHTPDWYKRTDPEWKQKGYHGQLLKQFGNIPEVRYLIAYDLHPGKKTRSQIVAKQDAFFRLYPNEETRAGLEQTIQLPDIYNPKPPETNREWAQRDPDGYEDYLLNALIKNYGDIPEVYIVARNSTKIMRGERLTDQESQENDNAVSVLMMIDKQNE